MAQIALSAPVRFPGSRTPNPRIGFRRAPGRPDTAPVAQRPAAPMPRLGLTRRGRFLLIGLPVMLTAAALLVLAGIFTAPVMAAGADDTAPVQGTSVTVLDGETLWGLAGEFAPERDRQDVIAEIAELNNLAGSTLVPGQELFIPQQP